MGRLDLVAVSLAMLEAVIGLSALGGFFLVRDAARAAASEDLVNIAPDLVRKLNLADMLLRDDRFEGTLRSMVAGEVDRVKGGDQKARNVSDDVADAIAMKVDGREGNGDGEF